VATDDDGVTRLVRDVLRFENFLVATSCHACMDPLCMTRCPVGSIRRKDTLDIVIEDWVHRLRQLRHRLPLWQHQRGAGDRFPPQAEGGAPPQSVR
jgi:hypothetical protein